MYRRIAAVIILSVTLACGSGETPATEKPADTSMVIPPTLQDTLLALWQQEEKAELEKDFATLDRIILPSFTMTRSDGQVWTRDQLYEDVRGMSADAYQSPIYDNVKVVSSNDTAFMSYRIGFPNQGVNAVDTNRFEMSSIWIRDSTWKLFRLTVGEAK